MVMSDIYWIEIIEAVKALQRFQTCGVGEVLSEETNKAVQKALEGICKDTCKLVNYSSASSASKSAKA